MDRRTTCQHMLQRLAALLAVASALFLLPEGAWANPAAATSALASDMPRLERAMVFAPDYSSNIQSNPRMSGLVESVDEQFSEVVRSSGRFRVIDDELGRQARRDRKVRAELVEQFEIDAFFTLEVNARADTIDLTARMLSPSFGILLQESEAVDLMAMVAASGAKVREILEGLVFRMVNRIPYDAKVLSIQGRFVVLSGGAGQGVTVGDSVEIMDIKVAGTHPATGAWTKFSTQQLGTGKIIEVKNNTAIAQLQHQAKPGAIRVGHSVKLARIASRARFAREDAEPEYGTEVLGSGSQVPIPVEPMLTNVPESPRTGAQPNMPSTPAVQLPRVARSEVPAVQPQASKKSPEPQIIADKPATVTDESEGGYGGGTDENLGQTWFGSIASGIFSDGELGLGLRSWSVSGPVAASTAAPYTLVNNISLRGTRKLSREASGDFETDLSFGSTMRASFTGYDLRANGYLEYPVSESGEASAGGFSAGPVRITKWRYGGVGRLVGLNVAGEAFGGLDAFFLGGFVGGRGKWDLGENSRGLAVQGDLFLYPLTVGSYGYRGAKQSIASALGTGVEFKIFRPATDAGATEYGLTWQYEMHSFALGNGRDAIYDSSRFYLGLRSQL